MTSRLAPRTRLGAVVAALALFATAGPARADTATFTGGRGGVDPVAFSGELNVRSTGTTTAVLTVTLKNTTSTGDALTAGFITGFGFNLPAGVTAGSPTTTDADFKLLNGSASTTFLQGGAFDYAFSLGNELHTVDRGRYNPALLAKGLGAGQSATFSVAISGAGAGSLTAATILAEKSAGSGTSAVPFSVRFRSTNTGIYKGLDDPDGDKVALDPKSVKTNPVPAPPGVVLASIGFGGLMVSRLRRRS